MCRNDPGHLAHLTTIILAGTVGDEYYMTRGHYHQKDSAEVYLGMSGTGLMLMQDRDGQFRIEALTNGVTVYVPPGWAHRTVNTGDQELVFLAVYFSDAGHDYRSIEEQGFAARVIAGANGPEVVGREAARLATFMGRKELPDDVTPSNGPASNVPAGATTADSRE